MMAQTLSKLLKDKAFCLLTTYSEGGEEVPTPMWFVLEGETVLMTTRGQPETRERLRHESKVKIGPCAPSGRPTGKQVKAQARELSEPDQIRDSIAALNKKYGLKKKLLDFGLRFAKDKSEAIIAVETA